MRKKGKPRAGPGAIWDATKIVDDSRFERLRAIVPNLQLRYPTRSEVDAIATSADIKCGVEETALFEQHIRSIILDAYLLNASMRTLSAKTVRGTLKSISKKALVLSKSLSSMDFGRGGAKERAGLLLERKLADLCVERELFLIPQIERMLDALGTAASRAADDHISKRGPKGVAGSPAFDEVIRMLYFAAWQRGGDWTNYRSADGRWTGTLLDALVILKPYLPSNFLQSEDRGRSIANIKRKLSVRITNKGRSDT